MPPAPLQNAVRRPGRHVVVMLGWVVRSIAHGTITRSHDSCRKQVQEAPAPLHSHGLVHSSGEKVPAAGSRLTVEPLEGAFLNCQERYAETQTPEGGGLDHRSLLVG